MSGLSVVGSIVMNGSSTLTLVIVEELPTFCQKVGVWAKTGAIKHIQAATAKSH
jgi:hypothetical protein